MSRAREFTLPRARRSTLSRARGFTLIELLVALSIFALMAAFSYRGLATLLDSREALEKESRKWRDVTVFIGRFERDLDAVLDRKATTSMGTPHAAVSSTLDATSAVGLALTRTGSGLQDSALAAPQRVAYRMGDGRIERLTWAALDSAPRAEPAATPVLGEVKSLAFRFMDPRGQWRTGWGAPGSPDPLPAAVEMTLELASGERIVRIVDLAGG